MVDLLTNLYGFTHQSAACNTILAVRNERKTEKTQLFIFFQ